MGERTKERHKIYPKYKIVKTPSKALNHFKDNKELILNEKYFSVLIS